MVRNWHGCVLPYKMNRIYTNEPNISEGLWPEIPWGVGEVGKGDGEAKQKKCFSLQNGFICSYDKYWSLCKILDDSIADSGFVVYVASEIGFWIWDPCCMDLFIFSDFLTFVDVPNIQHHVSKGSRLVQGQSPFTCQQEKWDANSWVRIFHYHLQCWLIIVVLDPNLSASGNTVIKNVLNSCRKSRFRHKYLNKFCFQRSMCE